jgi:N-acetylglucosamine repressor
VQKATPQRVRVHNTQLVLRTIYESGQISRAEIARVTRLTRPTVSDVVTGLMEDGLVEEVGYAPSSGGRRAILLRVVDDSRHLIGLDLGRGDFRGAVINLRGEIKHRVDLPLQGRDGDLALALVYDLVDALVESASSPLLGIGIGAPGLVDAVNGVVHQAVNLNWREVPLCSLLQTRYNLPVYMANDCQVAALAEYTFGSNEDSALDLVVIKAEWGVGAGIVHDGQLLHGNPLGAGEIGHVSVVEDGKRCACGNFGCLETVVSSRAIILRAQTIAQSDPKSLLHRFATDPETLTLHAVRQSLEAGDEAVRQVIHEVGQSLGISAANLVGVLGSCRILIAGSVVCFGQFLLDVIQEEMNKRTLPALASATQVRFASLGSDIVLLGASALLLPHELGLL